MTYYILAKKAYTQIPNLDEARRIAIMLFESGYKSQYVKYGPTNEDTHIIPIYKNGSGVMHSYVSRIHEGKSYKYYWTRKAWNRGTDTAYKIEKNGKIVGGY